MSNDGTINIILTTHKNIGSSKAFTFLQAVKQDNRLAFKQQNRKQIH